MNTALAATAVDHSSVYVKCVKMWGRVGERCGAAGQTVETAWPRTLIRSTDRRQLTTLLYRYAVHIDFPKIPVREIFFPGTGKIFGTREIRVPLTSLLSSVYVILLPSFLYSCSVRCVCRACPWSFRSGCGFMAKCAVIMN